MILYIAATAVLLLSYLAQEFFFADRESTSLPIGRSTVRREPKTFQPSPPAFVPVPAGLRLAVNTPPPTDPSSLTRKLTSIAAA